MKITLALAIMLLFMLAVSSAFAGDMSECRRGTSKCLHYSIDDVMGKSYALYPGNLYRSYVDRKYEVTSLAELEQHASSLPSGSQIYWNPGARSHEGDPLLFGKQENVAVFREFCRRHKISFEIAAFACMQNAECKYSCQTLETAECIRLENPFCNKHTCECWRACL